MYVILLKIRFRTSSLSTVVIEIISCSIAEASASDGFGFGLKKSVIFLDVMFLTFLYFLQIKRLFNSLRSVNTYKQNL